MARGVSPTRMLAVVAAVTAGLGAAVLALPAAAQTSGTSTTSTTGGSVTIQATCSVTLTTSGVGPGTWRNAVNTASGGGCSDGAGNQVINVQAGLGTITLNAGSPTYSGAQPLIINGSGVTIDMGGNNRAITLSTGAATTINNITFTNGSTSTRGGAIRATGPLTVNGCTFTGNSGGDGGGAISVDNALVTVNNSTFSGNHAQNGLNSNGGNGGAIRVHGTGNLIITGSTFTGNNANSDGFGGAWWVDFNGHATITNSTFANNNAQGDGGVGFISGGLSTVTAVGSTMSGNHAGSAGGVASGGALEVGGTVTLKNSTVTGNTTTNGGGGVDANSVNLAYADVDGNSAGVRGANIEIGRGGSLQTFASVISNPVGGQTNCGYVSITTATSSGYNFVSDTSCFPGGGAVAAATDKIVPGGDPQIGALANNGGPTLTQLPATTSPLVDAIPVSACQTAPLGTGITTDQRGITRPQGAGCDIGAVELQPVVAIVIQPRFTG
jgi:hypothetical protein